MTDTTQLPESVLARLIKESEISFPISGKVRNCGEYDYDQLQDRKQIGYVKGATTEAIRSLKLIRALEKVKIIRSKEEMEEMFIGVEETINEYNQPS